MLFPDDGDKYQERSDNSRAPKPNKYDLTCADKLRAAVLSRHPRRKAWNRIIWANQFRILRNYLSQDEKRITRVLDWFTKKLTDKATDAPRLASAAAFRKNFLWLEGLAMKSQGYSLLPEEEINEIMQWPHIKRLLWPTANSDDVRCLIATTAANYQEFLARLKALWLKRDEYSQTEALIINYFFKKLLTYQEFVIDWVTRVHSFIREKGWDSSWVGSLRKLAFTVTGKKFTLIGCDIARHYTGFESSWFDLLKLMGYRHESQTR